MDTKQIPTKQEIERHIVKGLLMTPFFWFIELRLMPVPCEDCGKPRIDYMVWVKTAQHWLI